jgi:hypothetical protein
MSNIRYCWLNLETGVFSNSWDEATHNEYINQTLINEVNLKTTTFKLIKYECLNDDNFEFYNLMKIVTNK